MMKKILTLLCVAGLAGCAISPVKPLYPAEAAKIKTVDVRVSAPKEALSVQQLISATTVTPTGPAYGGAGLLGAIIGAAIADAIINTQHKKNADMLRLQLAGLSDQVATLDYGATVSGDLSGRLKAMAPGKITSVRRLDKPLVGQAMADAAKTTKADAVLFVDISHSFSNGGIVRPGAAALPTSGMSLGIRANVVMHARDGTLLAKDSYVFVTPRSADAANEARVTWWRDNERYKELLLRTGPAFATALTEQIFGQPAYASEAQFNAQREADKKLTVQERNNRATATLVRFHACDDFYKTPLESTRFETYRSEAEGALRIGLVCNAAPAMANAKP